MPIGVTVGLTLSGQRPSSTRGRKSVRCSSIRVLARDGNGEWGGRVLSVGIVGSKDTISVSGDTFRWATGLKSTWWTVTNVTPDAKAPPRNVRASPRDQGLRVRWSAPKSDKRVRSYQVVVSPGDHTYKVPADKHSLRVRQLTNGREYRTKVRAIYHNGAGPPGVAPAVVPTSPMSYYRPLGPASFAGRRNDVRRDHSRRQGGGQGPSSGVGNQSCRPAGNRGRCW